MSATETIVTVSLDALVMDPAVQIRGTGTDPATVERYARAMNAGEEFPPPTVVPVDPEDPGRGYVLIDGWHRVEAIRANKGTEVTVSALNSETDRRRWKWIAVTMNRRHGKPLSRKDRRECFRAYVRAGEAREGGARRGRVKSARAMSRELLGIVSHPTLLKWMREDFPKTYEQMNKEDRKIIEDMPGIFGWGDPDEEMARIASGALAQVRAAFRALGAQEWRDVVTKEAQKLARELGEVLPRDYSDADAPWREIALPDPENSSQNNGMDADW